MNTTSIAKRIGHAVTKHSPEILTGFGIAGLLTTTVLAVKATPKAMKKIEAKKEELETDKLTFKETIQVTWKCYMPAAALAAASTGCLIGASKINLKRNAVLATAYEIAKTAHEEYREQVIETIGEKKEKEIQEKVSQKKVERQQLTYEEIVNTGSGNTLCYDGFSGRFFRANPDSLDRAVNKLNYRMLSENYISLNEFYAEIGLPCNDVGDVLGWRIEKGQILLHKESFIKDNEPCFAIRFENDPEYDYSSLY